LRESNCSWLARVMARNMEALLVTELSDTELNIRHFVNLIVLLEEDNITQSELGQRIGEAPYATSRIIDALEEKDWAERRKDPNSRRTHLIVLTKQGLDVAKGLPAIVQRVNKDGLSRLDKHEQQELVRLLQKAIGVGGDIEG
jgi:DNA-binding MarR family transcriptional regulator